MDYLKTSGRYPAITDLINSGGRIEIGYIYQMDVTIIAHDEGGTIWQGKRAYSSFEEALDDAEQGISKWIAENW
jgi:hypothetical protein